MGKRKSAQTDINFEIGLHEAWCICGSNRSGIAVLFERLAAGELSFQHKTDIQPGQVGVVSFKKQQKLYEQELAKDQTDFIDRIDPGTLARKFLTDIKEHGPLIDAFGLTPHLDQGYRQLSTGQSRKLLILSKITMGCRILLLEAPYDGLDVKSRKELDNALAQAFKAGTNIMVFICNAADISSWATHIAVVRQSKVHYRGGYQKMMPRIQQLLGADEDGIHLLAKDLKPVPKNWSGSEYKKNKELVRLVHAAAGYGGKNVFEKLSLTINKGDHTLVTGPNGCGKSTLLQVITGDHQACYTNDLRVFGMQRGQGESIWDIKKKMGIISSDLHRNWRVPGSVKDCVLSGFFDSIGIYQKYSPSQEREALQWLERLGLLGKKSAAFRSLDYADQRLVLIARAMIKVPQLLILDEPTQGLDDANRNALLDFCEDIATEQLCTILFVSHREDEFRCFFTQHVKMG